LDKNHNVISPFDAILAVAITFVLSLFLGSAFVVLFGYGVAMILGELLLLVVPLAYMLFQRINITNYVNVDVRLKTILLGIAIGAILLLANVAITAAVISVFGVSEAIEETNTLIVEMSGSLAGLVSVVVALSLAGLCEEFAFRGFLQNAITKKHSFGTALLTSSLVFGVFHFDPQAAYTVSAFIMGLLFGFIYHRWNSYVVPAVAHSTMNLVALGVMLFA